MSTPGRTDMLMKPTRVTHQALLSDQGLNIVVVFAHLGPLQAEALQQLASVGKTSRFWGLRASEREGFKGEWTRRLWGRINTRNIEGRGNAGSFRANRVKECSGFEGNLKAKRFDGSKRYWMRGKQGVHSKSKEFLEQTSEGTQWDEGNLTRRDMVKNEFPQSI